MVLSEGQFRFVFTAKDFDAAVRFYRDLLDLPVDHEWNYGPGDRGIVFHAARGMIEIFGRAPGMEYTRPQGVSMLIQVESADAWFQRFQERGQAVLEGPTTFPWGHRVVRVADPDGIVVSLFSLVEMPHHE